MVDRKRRAMRWLIYPSLFDKLRLPREGADARGW